MTGSADPPNLVWAEPDENPVFHDAAIVVAHDGIQALPIPRAGQVARDELVHYRQRIGPGGRKHLLARHSPKARDSSHGPIFVEGISDLVWLQVAVVQLEFARGPSDDRIKGRVLQPLSETRNPAAIRWNAHIARKLASHYCRIFAHAVPSPRSVFRISLNSCRAGCRLSGKTVDQRLRREILLAMREFVGRNMAPNLMPGTEGLKGGSDRVTHSQDAPRTAWRIG